MRNISFSLTTPQFKDRSKDVTRRLGWENLSKGEELMACEKCQGIPKGGKIVHLAKIVVIDVRREPLDSLLKNPGYGRSETTREGFPNLTPEEFVAMFCKHNGCQPDTIITRIVFKHSVKFPDYLPLLPPIPLGFDRWEYRGIKYASPRAIMVTSFDETTDPEWDPPAFFLTRGDDYTHYAEAVIDHHWICRCGECQANPNRQTHLA